MTKKFTRKLIKSILIIPILFLTFTKTCFAALKCPGVATDFKCLEDIYRSILNNIISAATVVMLIMLLSGGIKYLTSSGEPKDIENAKGRMTFAVLGVAALILIWFILKFLDIFLFGGVGVLTNFEIPK